MSAEPEYAFPQLARLGDKEAATGGLTIRDWFAVHFIKPACDAAIANKNEISPQQIAKDAYIAADAMIAERNRTK